MKILFHLVLSLLCVFSPAYAATFYGENPGSGVHQHQFRNASYLVYLPPDYDPASRYPIVLISFAYLGITEVDGEELFESWAKVAAERGYIIIFPMVGGTYEDAVIWWQDFLKDIKIRYSADRSRTFLTGFGDGGHLALHLGTSYPDFFLGVNSMSGMLEGPWRQLMNFKRSSRRPDFYFLAGDLDQKVNPVKVQTSADFLKKKGYRVKMETLPDAGHFYSDEMTLKTADWFDELRRRYPPRSAN